MQRMLRFQVACLAGLLASNGILIAQQANNPSDQFSTLGRRATTINQDVRQGPSNGTIVNENNGGPTGNNGAGSGAGQGGPGIMANYEPPSPANTAEDVSAAPISDADFARRIIEHGFLKAELGKLAVEKGQSD